MQKTIMVFALLMFTSLIQFNQGSSERNESTASQCLQDAVEFSSNCQQWLPHLQSVIGVLNNGNCTNFNLGGRRGHCLTPISHLLGRNWVRSRTFCDICDTRTTRTRDLCIRTCREELNDHGTFGACGITNDGQTCTCYCWNDSLH